MHTAATCMRGTPLLAESRRATAAARPAAVSVRAAQSLQGVVVRVAAKSAVVEVAALSVHPVYQKRVRVTTRHQAHDEEQLCSVGDTVLLAPSRPLSKTKRFTVETVVKKAQ